MAITHARRHDGLRRRLGIMLMAVAVIGAAVLVPGPSASAQEPTEEPAAAKPKPIEAIEQIALFASPTTDGVPNTVTSSFPPQVVCLVVPQLCADNSAPVRDPITGAIKDVDEGAESSPGQPVRPETVNVSFEAGNLRYQSGLTFTLPPVPEGQKVDLFQLILDQGQPTYSSSSPAFRQAVLAGVAGAGSQDPEVFAEQFALALEEDPVDQPPVGIEVCPFKSAYPIVPNGEEIKNEPKEPGSQAPPMAGSDETIPEQDSDGDGIPEPNVDCVFGGSGVFDPETSTWTFDLTFALQAFNDGTLKNNGFFFRPTGAPNLAFGDPDTSFNAAIALQTENARFRMATSEPPPPTAPLEPLPPPPPAETAAPAPAASTPPSSPPSSSPPPPSQSSGGFSSAPVTSGGGGFSSGSAPVMTSDPGPLVAETKPAPVAAEETAVEEAPVEQQLAAAPPAEQPGTFWLIWLLVPVFLAGMYLTSRSLTDDELIVAGVEREGAMSRLLQNRAEQTGGPATV